MPAESILVKWLNGEASPEEAAAIEAWVASDPEHRVAIERLWGIIHPEYVAPEPSAEWRAFRKKWSRLRLIRRLFWGALGTSALVWVGLHFLSRPPVVVSPHQEWRSGDQASRDTLAGGVTVFLDAHSVLRQVGSEVMLSGSAVFVGTGPVETGGAGRAEPGKAPLVVHLGPLTASAKGGVHFFLSDTLIQSFGGRLSVTDGKTAADLMPGQAVCYKDHRFQRVSEPDVNAYGYATLVFSFRDVPLKAVLPRLSSAYGVRFSVSDPALLNCRITTQFDNDSIETIMAVIAATLNLQYVFGNGHKTIRLSGKGCT